jgi:sensor c-di-GMP phosphodiesterase-like protein
MITLTKIQKWGIGAVIGIVLLTLAYCRGKSNGADNQALANNATAIHQSDSVIKNAQHTVDTLKVISDQQAASRTILRSQVRIVHDTTIISRLVYADDSLIKADSNTIHAQGVDIEALRVGISDRDARIKILDGMKIPRTMRGLQVGVGGCQSAARGITPCVYLGYGFTLRF